jgi:hypothetical protein
MMLAEQRSMQGFGGEQLSSEMEKETVVSRMSNAPTAHADHLKWRSDHAAWRKESQEWLAECRAALSELAQLEQEFQSQCESIDLHHESIEGLECQCAQHERLIEMEPAPPSAARLEAESAQRHAQQAELHQRQAELHRKLKERQHELLSRHAVGPRDS